MREKRTLEIGLTLSLALAALDTAIVATAVPSIARSLGGFALFPWLFSAYLVSQAVATPICGRLADTHGRRPVLMGGVVTFLVASALASAAWSMPALIVFRALQGLGAGGIQPLINTIAGDLYPAEQRGRIQAWFSGVQASAAIGGPLVGGLLVSYLSWQWIFLVNLPVGIVALTLIARTLFEPVIVRRERAIDTASVGLLVGGVICLMLVLLEGGAAWAWRSFQLLGVAGVAAALLAAFAWRQRRVEQPLLPPWLLTRRALLGSAVCAGWMGVAMIGVTAYMPAFAQGVLGVGPIEAGLVLGAMLTAWPLASVASVALYRRIGFRDAALAGAAVSLCGAGLLALPSVSASVWGAAGACALVGSGFGVVTTATLVGIQSIVDRRERGVVTGANMFTRLLGQAVGAAAFGAVANTTLARWFAAAPAAVKRQLPAGANAAVSVLGGHSGPSLSSTAQAYVRSGLELAGHRVFLGVGVATLAIIGAILLTPRWFSPLSLSEGGGDAAVRPRALTTRRGS